jgi:tRNA(Ile)-lysidine synthase
MVTKDPLIPAPAVRARVRRFIVEHNLIERGDRVLAAVSGGPDSTSLLLVLASLRRPLGFELHAAHFDHGLRGKRAGEREERFVRSLTERLGVPLRAGSGDVRARAKGRSLEDAAREVRYRFLADAARRQRCNVVAAGHTKDDQAETVLLHIIRGSGMAGLAGMAARAAWPFATLGVKPRLVRPLLSLSREDTERVCREAGVTPIEDPSNRSLRFLRNRVRAELLPLLRAYNPKIEDALGRLARSAATNVSLVESLADWSMADETIDPAKPRLNRRRFAILPPSLQGHAIRHVVRLLLGDGRDLSERHVRAIVRVNRGRTGATLDLPRRLHVRVGRDVLEFSVGKAPAGRKLPAQAVPLRIGRTARIGSWQITAWYRTAAPAKLASDGLTAYLDADSLSGKLVLRRRRDGDRFQPLGMSRPKKLQDFFVDAHVPREERDATPLLVSDRGIAWVAGQRPAEWAKLTRRTRRVLWLRASRAGT